MADSQGQCMCGAIRYRFTGSAAFSAVCHCRQCQRQTSSAFSIVTGVAADAFQLEGETKIFADRGLSGKAVARHFCPDCGSPIMSVLDAAPGMVFIKSGTLDDFAGIRPSVEVFCDNALAFLPSIGGTEKYARSNLGEDV